ncbi:hypothetical protein A9P82_12130 [Arachidicoccus ginsenosidimutans]|uniref:alpha/beta hydrolase family protein n=1 Tax=Arachidicoccus sp. BS20 TaxID=1850526 RepID=UPI0007F1261B|nr:hypothetical protein [Arachidicoccus sp. BS20]ANI89967.1 hypothetical protein A9P82_12130 [Arachidicoccus sp. BS20]
MLFAFYTITRNLGYLVKSYAERGYVTLAFDLPGICNSAKTPYSFGKWKTRAVGEAPRFDIDRNLTNSTLTDAEVTGIEGFNYLCAQQNVDIKNVGITGFSWGGYSTTFLSGILGKRVKAAYAVFGCGYFDKGSFWKKIIDSLSPDIRRKWLRYFDAGRRAGNIKAPYFLEATSNDTYFWPEAVDNTLDVIPGIKNHVWDTNFNHRQMPSGHIMQQLYFDYYLKGKGQPFGTAKIAGEQQLSNGNKVLTIEVNEPANITVASVILYYSERAKNWQERKWIPLNTTLKSGNIYTVELPAKLIKEGVCCYGFVTDNRGVSVSTYMYHSINFSKVL